MFSIDDLIMEFNVVNILGKVLLCYNQTSCIGFIARLAATWPFDALELGGQIEDLSL